MISGSIFSMADLNAPSTYLYAKIKYQGVECNCEIKEDNSIYDAEDETSEVLIKLPNGTVKNETVKTSKLYELDHSNVKRW